MIHCDYDSLHQLGLSRARWINDSVSERGSATCSQPDVTNGDDDVKVAESDWIISFCKANSNKRYQATFEMTLSLAGTAGSRWLRSTTNKNQLQSLSIKLNLTFVSSLKCKKYFIIGKIRIPTLNSTNRFCNCMSLTGYQ